MFGRTMRIPDELLPSGGGSSPSRSRRRASRWSRSSRSRAGSSRARTARRLRAAAEEHFTRVVRQRRGARGGPGRRASRTAIPVHLPALLVASFGVGSTSEARRLIAQGGVKLDGEPVGELDVPRERLAARCSRSASAASALDRRLTSRYTARPSDGRRGTVPNLDDQEPPGRLVSIRFVHMEASGASRRLFFAVRPAPVFENSTASVHKRRDLERRPSRRRERHNLVVSSDTTFERKLKVKASSASARRTAHFTSTNRSLQGRLVSDTIRFKKEASGASRRLFFAVSGLETGARSLKTQQRSVQTSRPRPAQPHCGGTVERHNLVVPSGTTFEHQAQSEKTRRLRPAIILHGEFDPGSGRTLAARLTHASRARTGPSGPGKAANG